MVMVILGAAESCTCATVPTPPSAGPGKQTNEFGGM
jgi:hypothetical protein